VQPDISDAVELTLPFTGAWRVVRGPADRVPSHGTHSFGLAYAFDFAGVDERGRTTAHGGWRRFLATEPPGRFVGFGRPILAPATGLIVTVHDDEPDGPASRSPIAQLRMALVQGRRVRRGAGAVAGNHVVLALEASRFVLLAHLRRGSVRVRPGDTVAAGDVIGECGSSGNSTEPHLHLQAMDAADPWVARGLPIVFRGYHVVGAASSSRRAASADGVPGHRQVIEPGPG
jgi:murein DD-endopeptidase MepM/ murein hydrolase activator NlpD